MILTRENDVENNERTLRARVLAGVVRRYSRAPRVRRGRHAIASIL